jgi:hypothetical protein
MASRLNTLRYGSLHEAWRLMDGDDPLDQTELRALVFNLVDVVRVQQKEIDRLTEASASRSGEQK